MNKLIIFGLLAMLVIVAGCAQKAPEQAADQPELQAIEPVTPTAGTTELDAGASEADSLNADLASEDVDQQLDSLNPEEVKDINF